MANDDRKLTTSDKQKQLLWDQYLKSNPGPNNIQLCQLIIQSEPLRDLALKQFLKQNPRKSELYWLIREGTPEVKNEAFSTLLEKDREAYNYLVSIAIQIDEFSDDAWNKLVGIGIKGKELRLISDYRPSLKEACWKIIITQEITNYELLVVMRSFPDLLEAAWEKMLVNNYTHYDLCRVITTVPDLRKKAWKELQKAGPTNTDLHYLIDRVPSLRKVAELKLYKETEDVMNILKGIY